MRISDWSSDVCSSDLEIGTPARKRNEGVQGDSVAARGQYVGKQRTAEQRPSHFRYLLFRQSRPADREPRFLQRLAQRGDARRSIGFVDPKPIERSEEHTSELQSLMRNSYAVFCLKKKQTNK